MSPTSSTESLVLDSPLLEYPRIAILPEQCVAEPNKRKLSIVQPLRTTGLSFLI